MALLFPNSIAVTGGFASGKSTVARKLADIMAYHLLDADDEVAWLLKKGHQGWTLLRELIDSSLFLNDGEIDKAKLREMIFSDLQLRAKVEGILHPLVKKSLKIKADDLYQKTGGKSVVEVPLLFEAKWQDDFPYVVVVSSANDVAKERALIRDEIDDKHFNMALTAQLSLKKKMKWADHVIDNNGSLEETITQLESLKKKLQKKELDTRGLKP